VPSRLHNGMHVYMTNPYAPLGGLMLDATVELVGATAELIGAVAALVGLAVLTLISLRSIGRR